MKCPFCQNEMGDAQTGCPHCGRPHSVRVAHYIEQMQESLQRGSEQEARAAFKEAMGATPPNDKQPLERYVARLFVQAKAPAAAGEARFAQPPAAPQAPVAPSQPATVSAPAPRPQAGQPPAGAAKQALFFNFNEKPVNIVRVMDDARRKQMEFARTRRWRMWILALLLPAGLPFICADVSLGYNICTFSLVALVLWGAALVGFILLRRNRPTGQEFGPQFDVARTVFETLKDDVSPKRTLIGWLDLTGMQQPGKIVQQRTSSSGMPIAFYRDEWLRMKLPLYDGNVMRVSAIERMKARLGQWKTGHISGKRKWKPGGTVWARRELRVAVTVNRDVYEVLPFQEASQVGKFLVDAKQSDDGRIVLTALADGAVGSWDMLQVLRFAYDHLKPRGTPAT
jgi:hypothetical protein